VWSGEKILVEVAKTLCAVLNNGINQGITTTRRRHFVYRHFIYRYFVYYDFPCWSRSWSD